MNIPSLLYDRKEIDTVCNVFSTFNPRRLFTCSNRNQILQSSCHGLQNRVQRVGHNKPPSQDTRVHNPEDCVRVVAHVYLFSYEIRGISLLYSSNLQIKIILYCNIRYFLLQNIIKFQIIEIYNFQLSKFNCRVIAVSNFLQVQI